MPGILTIRTSYASSIGSVKEFFLVQMTGTVHTHVCGRIPELTFDRIRTVFSTIALQSSSSLILLV